MSTTRRQGKSKRYYRNGKVYKVLVRDENGVILHTYASPNYLVKRFLPERNYKSALHTVYKVLKENDGYIDQGLPTRTYIRKDGYKYIIERKEFVSRRSKYRYEVIRLLDGKVLDVCLSIDEFMDRWCLSQEKVHSIVARARELGGMCRFKTKNRTYCCKVIEKANYVLD